MPHNSTFTSAPSAAEMAGMHAVGITAFLVFGLIGTCSLLFTAIRRAATHGAQAADPVLFMPSNGVMAQVLATFLLACGWLFAGANGLLWRGGCIERVLVNVLAWDWTLARATDFFEVQEPMRSNYLAPVRRGALVLLAAAAVLGYSERRFVALVGVLPLAMATLLAASLWAGNRARGIIPRKLASGSDSIRLFSNHKVRPGIFILCMLVPLGAWELIFEPLSTEYGGSAGVVTSLALTLVVHVGLVAFWFLVALMDAKLPRLHSGSPDEEGNIIGSPPSIDGEEDGVQSGSPRLQPPNSAPAAVAQGHEHSDSLI